MITRTLRNAHLQEITARLLEEVQSLDVKLWDKAVRKIGVKALMKREEAWWNTEDAVRLAHLLMHWLEEEHDVLIKIDGWEEVTVV